MILYAISAFLCSSPPFSGSKLDKNEKKLSDLRISKNSRENAQRHNYSHQMMGKNRVYNLWDGGPTPVARGGSGAETPPLVARQKRGLQLPWDLFQNSSLLLFC